MKKIKLRNILLIPKVVLEKKGCQQLAHQRVGKQRQADRSSLHQRLAIRELIDTEVSYLHMLQLCASDIRGRLQQVLAWGHTQPIFIGTNVSSALETSCLFLGQA